MTERGEDYIVLKSGENLEYGYSADGSAWTWQTDPKFTGLKPQTAYQFASRVKFDSSTSMESAVSPVSTFKTFIPFSGSIEGVTEGGIYDKNTKLTATAVGAGMDNTAPTVGDSRWVPSTWNWDGVNNRSWKQPPYAVTFTLDKVGDYKMTVGFTREEYTADGWKSTGIVREISVAFKAKAPVYTITASAGKNGKISPAGTVSIEEGKNAEFTATPDKGYRLAKVVVDGTSVKFQNNKYTFTNVTGNHTISVTFERIANLTSPKTGENRPIIGITALVILSAAVIVLIVIMRRRQAKKQD